MSQVTFNGDVTINGDVKIVGDNSIEISSKPINVDVNNLDHFINSKFSNSSEKATFLEAAKILRNSQNQIELKNATNVLTEMVIKLGVPLLLTGLSSVVTHLLKF